MSKTYHALDRWIGKHSLQQIYYQSYRIVADVAGSVLE